MNAIKITVIIPVFNAEDRIAFCLDSLRMQTLDNLEIILVNDHGSDNSMNVANQYAASHPEMNFVFLDNGRNLGPGAARNNGLKHASGKYVAFVDSDDWVVPEFCESLYVAAESSNAEMAYCHAYLDYPDRKCQITSNPTIHSWQSERKHFLNKYKTYFTTFIYNRQFILDNAISFPDTRCAEDSCFLLCSLLSCSRIASVDKPLYHYVIDRNSISQSKNSLRWKDRLKSFSIARRFAIDHNLYRRNCLLFEWLALKKGCLLAMRDLVRNLKTIS